MTNLGSRRFLRLVSLPPDLARQMRDSLKEAFSILGDSTAELILYFTRERYRVDPQSLPQGIDDLDRALKEILGTGTRQVVNQCAITLSMRLGREIRPTSDRLSDLFRQVAKGAREQSFPIRPTSISLIDETKVPEELVSRRPLK